MGSLRRFGRELLLAVAVEVVTSVVTGLVIKLISWWF